MLVTSTAVRRALPSRSDRRWGRNDGLAQFARLAAEKIVGIRKWRGRSDERVGRDIFSGQAANGITAPRLVVLSMYSSADAVDGNVGAENTLRSGAKPSLSRERDIFVGIGHLVRHARRWDIDAPRHCRRRRRRRRDGHFCKAADRRACLPSPPVTGAAAGTMREAGRAAES